MNRHLTSVLPRLADTKLFSVVSYDKDDLQYTWKKDVGTEIYIYDKEMAQFTVFNATRKLKHSLYHSGDNMITMNLPVWRHFN